MLFNPLQRTDMNVICKRLSTLRVRKAIQTNTNLYFIDYVKTIFILHVGLTFRQKNNEKGKVQATMMRHITVRIFPHRPMSPSSLAENRNHFVLPLQKFHMNMFQNHTCYHMWFWNMFMWNFCKGCLCEFSAIFAHLV